MGPMMSQNVAAPSYAESNNLLTETGIQKGSFSLYYKKVKINYLFLAKL